MVPHRKKIQFLCEMWNNKHKDSILVWNITKGGLTAENEVKIH